MSQEAEPREFIVRGVVVGLFQENCYIIGSRRTREAVVIDPGDEPEAILALARDMGVEVKRIVCTHAHVDHIMAARAIKEATGAPFLLHPDDLELARQVPATALKWGLRASEPPPPDFLVRHRDDLELAGTSIKVIHTPGHTQGSISLYVAGMLFSGDTLFRGSIGRTDLPGGDYQQLMRSLFSRVLTLPEDTIVLPGHMLETTIGREKQTNPFVLQEARRLRQE